MELNINEQEEKLKAEAQKIGERRAEIQEIATQLAKEDQQLINDALKNQGALDLLNSLNGREK